MRRPVWFSEVAIAIALMLPAVALAAATNDRSTLARGRYMLITGNCNDCHTPNYPPRDGKVAEREWMLGSAPLGFRGPWGTTYAPNLRLTVSRMSERQWVTFAKQLKTRPPMPWFHLNQTHEADLRAMYRFIKHLGPIGDPVPAYIPPDQEPPQPYVQWPGGK